VDSTAGACRANRLPAHMHAPSPELLAPQTEHLRSEGQSVEMLALVSLVAVTFAVLVLRPAADLPETRVEINTPATPQPLHFAISSDGRQLVFVASGDGVQRLWLRPLDATAARPLAGTDGAEYPFWSPDGHSIGFFASGKLKRVDMGGGPPQPIADAAAGWWDVEPGWHDPLCAHSHKSAMACSSCRRTATSSHKARYGPRRPPSAPVSARWEAFPLIFAG
jgi:hypothetical protein